MHIFVDYRQVNNISAQSSQISAKSGSHRTQIGEIQEFFRSDFCKFRLYEIPGIFSFGAVLTHFGSRKLISLILYEFAWPKLFLSTHQITYQIHFILSTFLSESCSAMGIFHILHKQNITHCEHPFHIAIILSSFGLILPCQHLRTPRAPTPTPST